MDRGGLGAASRENEANGKGRSYPTNLAHLSPLKWEHINLTSEYPWRTDARLQNRKLRPLRTDATPEAFT